MGESSTDSETQTIGIGDGPEQRPVTVRNRFGYALAICCLLIIPIFVYRYSFSFPYVFEDNWVNRSLYRLSAGELAAQFVRPNSVFGMYYRPTADLLTCVVTKLAGVTDPFRQHAAYYAVLCVTVLVLMELARSLRVSRSAAILIATFYITSAVQLNYYLGMGQFAFDRWMLLFVLLVHLVATKQRLWMLAPVAAFCALSSKDTALVLPGLYVIYLSAVYLADQSWRVRAGVIGEAAVDGTNMRFRRGVYAGILCALVFGGFLVFKIYSAMVLGRGGLPFGKVQQIAGIAEKASYKFSDIEGNLRRYSAFLLESWVWPLLPDKCYAQWLPEPPGSAYHVLLLVLVAFAVIAPVYCVISRRAVTDSTSGVEFESRHAPAIFTGAAWCLLALAPNMFFAFPHRVLSYRALLASAGLSLTLGAIFAYVISRVCRLFRGKAAAEEGVSMSLTALLVIALFALCGGWNGTATATKEFWRSAFIGGTETISDFPRALQSARWDGKEAIYVTTLRTPLQGTAWTLSQAIPSYFNERKVSFDWLDLEAAQANVSAQGLAAAHIAVPSTHSLLLAPLTDRLAPLRWTGRTAEAANAAANPLIENGNFASRLESPYGQRPRYWLPFPIPGPCRVEFLQGSDLQIRINGLATGLGSGLEQAIYLQQGRIYKVSFNTRWSGETQPMVALASEETDDIEAEFQTGRSSEAHGFHTEFSPRTSGVYHLRLGAGAVGRNGFVEYGNVQMQELETQVALPISKDAITTGPNLFPGLENWSNVHPVTITDQSTSEAAMLLIHDPATDKAPDPNFKVSITRSSLPYEEFRLRARARAATSNVLHALVTVFGGVHGAGQADTRAFAVAWPLAPGEKTLQELSRDFALGPEERLVRVDIFPIDSRAAGESTGSVELANFTLQSVGAPLVTTLPAP